MSKRNVRGEETRPSGYGFLTLTRYIGERIYIGEDIEVVATAITGARQVRISVRAPKTMRIDRAEKRDEEKENGSEGSTG